MTQGKRLLIQTPCIGPEESCWAYEVYMVDIPPTIRENSVGAPVLCSMCGKEVWIRTSTNEDIYIYIAVMSQQLIGPIVSMQTLIPGYHPNLKSLASDSRVYIRRKTSKFKVKYI